MIKRTRARTIEEQLEELEKVIQRNFAVVISVSKQSKRRKIRKVIL